MNLAIITGASSGLGREYARVVAEKYPQLDEILLIARRRERLEELALAFPSRRVHVLPLDLTAPDAMDVIGRWLTERGARVGLLINNAGMGVLGDVADSAPETQGHLVDLNCRALVMLTTLCLKYLDAGAVLVNVCSIASFVPNPRLNTYSATKAFVLSFTKGLRFELKPRGVNALAVCPAPMDTEFLPVAGIGQGASHTFDVLPRVKPPVVAERSLAAAFRGRCVYTNGLFYKVFRVLGKLLPHNWLMRFTAC